MPISRNGDALLVSREKYVSFVHSLADDLVGQEFYTVYTYSASRCEVKRAIDKLSVRFTSCNFEADKAISKKGLRFWLQVRWQRPGFVPERVLDFGSGLGSALW